MSFAMLKPVPFHQIEISDNFWSSRLTTLRKETIRYCIRRCEETGRIANFRRAGKLEEGGFQGIYFNDSDVYKVLEGAAYVLHNQRDEELERITNGIIEAICAAQQEDGYLFSYYILTGLDQRWKDMGYHEAYCLGHMLEGAIAYYQATGKRRWLDTAVRALEQMMTVIGPGKKKLGGRAPGTGTGADASVPFHERNKVFGLRQLVGRATRSWASGRTILCSAESA